MSACKLAVFCTLICLNAAVSYGNVLNGRHRNVLNGARFRGRREASELNTNAADVNVAMKNDTLEGQRNVDGTASDSPNVSGFSDGTNIVAMDSNTVQNPKLDGSLGHTEDGSAKLLPVQHTDQQAGNVDHQSNQHRSGTEQQFPANWQLQPQFFHQAGHFKQPDHHSNQHEHHGDTSTLEPTTTTMDPEEAETTTAEPDHHPVVEESHTDHSSVQMSRPGESPPLALPLTSEGHNNAPIMTSEGGDTPRAQAQTAHQGQQMETVKAQGNPFLQGQGQHKGQNGFQFWQGQGQFKGQNGFQLGQSQGQFKGQSGFQHGQGNSGMEGFYNPNNPLLMKTAWQQGSSEGHDKPVAMALSSKRHDRPVALALTSQSETNHPRPPVAMAQTSKSDARPPPNWGSQPGNSQPQQTRPSPASEGALPTKQAQTGSAPETTTPNMMNNLAAMQMMGGGDMFSNMMEMQRKMMQYNPQVWQQMQQQQMQMYKQMFPQLFPGGTSSGGSGATGQGQNQTPTMPFPGMYGFGEDGYNPMMMGMANGMNLNFQSPYLQPTHSPQIQEACKTNPKSPLCDMSKTGPGFPPAMAPYMMGDEFEGGPFEEGGPFGEIELEGPMAYQFLSQMKMTPNNVHPNHQEITLNHHVLKALERRFGVNTTAGIQKKASDPQFQAFMFQVLKKSTQSVPGEYHANLSQAEVDQILASLDASAAGNERLPTGNLDHASLAGSSTGSNGAVLTLDNGAPQPPWFPGFAPQVAQPGSFSPLVQQPGAQAAKPGSFAPLVQQPGAQVAQPGSFAPLVQQPGAHAAKPGSFAPLVQQPGAKVAQPGSFAPLVQQPGEAGETGEAGEAGEGGEAGEAGRITEGQTSVTNANKTNRTDTVPSSQMGISDGAKGNNHAPLVAGTVAVTAGVLSPSTAGKTQPFQTVPETQQSVDKTLPVQTGSGTQQSVKPNFDMSQASQSQSVKSGSGNTQESLPSQNAGAPSLQAVDKNTGVLPGADIRTGGVANVEKKVGVLPGAAASTAGAVEVGTVTDNRPIGLQEAGIFPGTSNDTVAVEIAPAGYSTSTVFAIAAILLIALMIIIGPVICMLCKMRERRQEKLRKIKALKNREVSENNIMEAMMLHEFGSAGPSSIENENAAARNYYKVDHSRYDTIDPEIECLNKSHPLP